MRCSLQNLLRKQDQQKEGEEQHNARAEEDLRQALSSAVGQSRLLLSVAAGTIVLSATFLSAIYVGRSLCLLVAAWILLGISMFVGFVVHGEYTAQLAESDLTVRSGPLENELLVQLLAVLAGLVCFGLFVLGNVNAGPQLEIRRAAVVAARGEVTVTIACRSGAGTGCRGEVTVRRGSDSGGPEVGHTVFAQDQDGPNAVPLRLTSRTFRRLVRADPHRLVEVEVRAQGRFGNESTATETLELEDPPPERSRVAPQSD